LLTRNAIALRRVDHRSELAHGEPQPFARLKLVSWMKYMPTAKHLFGWQARVPNISAALIERAHRRYALSSTDADVAEAWSQLADSAYTLDLWGMDSGGTTHIPGTNYDNFA